MHMYVLNCFFAFQMVDNNDMVRLVILIQQQEIYVGKKKKIKRFLKNLKRFLKIGSIIMSLKVYLCYYIHLQFIFSFLSYFHH